MALDKDGGTPRLLVTGGNGVLGWNLCRLATQTWQTFGTVHRHPVVPAGVHACPVDLTDERSVTDLFTATKPDAVVHAAALSSPDYCQDHPAESEAVNVVASQLVASLCARARIPCVFTSSDLVFDGEHPPYDETHPTNPLSLYGEQKVRAEEAMRRCYPETTICRLPLMFGAGSPASQGFFARMLQTMREGKEVPLFVDEMRTPVSTETASHGLILALTKLRGMTIHLGGGESISRWDLARLAAEVFAVRSPRLVRCHQRDVPSRAPRPRDVSLNSGRARDIGFLPPTIRQQMRYLRNMMEGPQNVAARREGCL